MKESDFSGNRVDFLRSINDFQKYTKRGDTTRPDKDIDFGAVVYPNCFSRSSEKELTFQDDRILSRNVGRKVARDHLRGDFHDPLVEQGVIQKARFYQNSVAAIVHSS